MKKYMKLGAIALAVVLVYIVGALVIPPALRPEAQPVALPEAAAGERVACVEDNVDALIWRLRIIEAAREELILSTFDFGTGRAGQDMMAALLKAAERGVHIRILLDGYNSGETMKSPYFQALASAEGVQVRVYNSLNLLTLWDANFRMHDKYLMADSRMYLLGGRNTNNLFLGDYSDTPNIDRDILVYGTGSDGSGGRLMAYFQQVWDASQPQTCEKSDKSELYQRYENLKKSYPDAFGFADWEGSTVEAAGVSLICGQIQESAKAPLVWKQLCDLMAQGEQVLIQTPYAICGDEMYDDLEAIADGGTQIKILTNSPETGANPFGCTDLRKERRNLLDAGMTLLEYAGDHSLHAKMILIDDNISIVGSFNLDMRSAYIDTETMLVVDCPALNARLREQTGAMAEECLQTNPDGSCVQGACYTPKTLDLPKSILYAILGVVSVPFRHLM